MENPFEPCHTAVPVVFYTCALVFTMASMNPACVGVAFAGALVCSLVVRGVPRTGETLRWALPLWGIIMLINGIYSASQAATIVPLGPVAFGVESLCYGATAGAMICAMVLWFAAAGDSISSDSAVGIIAPGMPHVALMLSQVLRLVPQMLRRGGDVLAVQGACRVGDGSRRESLRDRVRVVSVLVGWSMEDGAIRAESMRARGYGSSARRTHYRQRRFRSSDAFLVAAIGAVGVWACVAAAAVGSQFQFYPLVGAQATWGTWWACLPGIALVCAVPLLSLRSAWRWR